MTESAELHAEPVDLHVCAADYKCIDHVSTEASKRASQRAIEAAYNDEPRIPFYELVREEQRKMLRVVRDEDPE